jgi:hypothetical protein
VLDQVNRFLRRYWQQDAMLRVLAASPVDQLRKD